MHGIRKIVHQCVRTANQVGFESSACPECPESKHTAKITRLPPNLASLTLFAQFGEVYSMAFGYPQTNAFLRADLVEFDISALAECPESQQTAKITK